jgi:hypothetical protein
MRPAQGILKFKCWQEEKKTRPGRHDMVIINPPLKGLMILDAWANNVGVTGRGFLGYGHWLNSMGCGHTV